MAKVKLEIEGQLCDLADLFAALAQATAQPVTSSEVKQVFQFRGAESGVGEFKEGVTYPKIDHVDMLDGQHGSYYLNRANPTETQSENTIEPDGETNDGKVKRTRRTKAQLEVDKAIEEATIARAQANEGGLHEYQQVAIAEALEKGVSEIFINTRPENIGTAPDPAPTAENIGTAPDPAPTAQPIESKLPPVNTASVEAEQQAPRNILTTAIEDVRRAEQESQTVLGNHLLVGINFDGPYIETMRKASQLMITKNAANKDLILGLLSEFGAKGLSEVKDEDKIAFKMRFKDLPFKG